MVVKKEVPFSELTDHDLLIHVLPTIYCAYDLKEVLERVIQINDPVVRAWVFEMVFLVGYLTEVDKMGIKDCMVFIKDSAIRQCLWSLKNEGNDKGILEEINLVLAYCEEILLKQELINNLNKHGAGVVN